MIELKSIVKIYNNYYNNKVTALKGINLKFPSTGMTFIVGPSGCGKSTLLNILSGVDVQTSGKMSINGVNTENLGAQGFDGYRNNFVGIVHQDILLLDHLTLGQNVALALELKGTKPEATSITELFKKLGLEGMENRYPNQCSIGQCQRVAIARTLIKKPKILIADEPTSSIDQETRMDIYRILQELSKEILVVATTHNREIAERFADRTIMMADGAVVSDIITGGYNSNIELFDQGRVVAVVPGAALAADDIDKVNDIIRKNNKKGLYLCFETDPARVQVINPNAAKEIVAPKMKEKQKTKEKFKKEKLELIENSNASGIFQFEKTTLPMKNAWKLSTVNFSSNKLRSIFTVVLSFLAIMFFALTSNLSRVDVNRLIINTFSGSDNAYITYASSTELFNSTNRYGDNLGSWTSNNTYNNSGLIYDYGKSIITEAPEFAKGPETQGSASYDGKIYGIRKVIVDDTSTGNTNKFGLELSAGRWANSNSADAKSIVISDFIAVQLQTAYYMRAKNTGETIGTFVPSFAEMVQQNPDIYDRNKIRIDGNDFNIIGIYKTDFKDYFVFDSTTGYLKTYPETQTYFTPEALRIKPSLTKNEKLRAEYRLQNDYVTGFVSAEFISKGFLGDGYNLSIYTLSDASAASDFFITQHSAGAPKGKMYDGIQNAITKSQETGGIAFVNCGILPTETDVEPGIIKISKKFYTEFINDTPSAVSNFTIQEGVDRTLTFNIAKSNYSYNILQDSTEIDSGANMLEKNESVYKYNVLKTFTFEIFGELLDDTYGDYTMLLAETDFNELMQALVLPSSSFAVAGSYGAQILQSIFDNMGDGMTPSFADSSIIQEHAGSYESLSGAMITASIALAVFVTALMYNYIFQSIRSKRKSIAVIRSMGARTWDIFKIFILEALLIAGLICFSAFISTVIAAAIGNAIIAGAAGISLMIFRLDATFLLILLSITILIILASYMLPVFAYSRHTSGKGLVRNLNVKSDN